MQPSPEDLVALYVAMSEVELMELAQDYDLLTATAQAALRSEFTKRNLDPPALRVRPQFEVRNLVTVQRYRDLTEAIVAHSLLEAQGLEAWIQDENLIRIDWAYSNAIGGVRLQVDAENYAAAAEILAQLPVSIPFAEGAEYIQPQCSRCGSVDLSLLPMVPNAWICGGCGARGQIVEDDTAEAGPVTNPQ